MSRPRYPDVGFEPGDALVAQFEEGRLDLALIPRTLDHVASTVYL